MTYTVTLRFDSALPLRWVEMRLAAERAAHAVAEVATGQYYVRLATADGVGRSVEQYGFYEQPEEV